MFGNNNILIGDGIYAFGSGNFVYGKSQAVGTKNSNFYSSNGYVDENEITKRKDAWPPSNERHLLFTLDETGIIKREPGRGYNAIRGTLPCGSNATIIGSVKHPWHIPNGSMYQCEGVTTLVQYRVIP